MRLNDGLAFGCESAANERYIAPRSLARIARFDMRVTAPRGFAAVDRQYKEFVRGEQLNDDVRPLRVFWARFIAQTQCRGLDSLPATSRRGLLRNRRNVATG